MWAYGISRPLVYGHIINILVFRVLVEYVHVADKIISFKILKLNNFRN